MKVKGKRFLCFCRNKFYANTKERLQFNETPYESFDIYLKKNHDFLIEKFNNREDQNATP